MGQVNSSAIESLNSPFDVLRVKRPPSFLQCSSNHHRERKKTHTHTHRGRSKNKTMGVVKEVVKTGNGPTPKKGQKITVHCTGIVQQSNKKFWSTKDPGQQPFSFNVGLGSVIRGWDEGIITMQLGEQARLTCTPDYAYGPTVFLLGEFLQMPHYSLKWKSSASIRMMTYLSETAFRFLFLFLLRFFFLFLFLFLLRFFFLFLLRSPLKRSPLLCFF